MRLGDVLGPTGQIEVDAERVIGRADLDDDSVLHDDRQRCVRGDERRGLTVRQHDGCDIDVIAAKAVGRCIQRSDAGGSVVMIDIDTGRGLVDDIVQDDEIGRVAIDSNGGAAHVRQVSRVDRGSEGRCCECDTGQSQREGNSPHGDTPSFE